MAKKTCSNDLAVPRYSKLHPNELKTLVANYQQGDALAAERICQRFTPLVKSLTRRQYVYNSYGEDAENMLWLWLLEFITTYEGDNFRMLPGLIRRHLICKLMRCAEQNSRRWNTEQITDLSNVSYTNIPDKNDALQKELLTLSINQELTLLPKKQQHILRRFYLEQESQNSIATSLHCTTRAVRLQQNAALQSIRKRFIGA